MRLPLSITMYVIFLYLNIQSFLIAAELDNLSRGCSNWLEGKRTQSEMLKLHAFDSFKAYLEMLIQKQVINVTVLEAWLDQLEDGVSLGSLSLDLISESLEWTIHRDGFLHLLLNVESEDKAKYLNWFKFLLEREVQNKKARGTTEKETAKTYHKMNFVKIERGDFSVPEGHFHLSYDFVVLDTPVTQMMWYEVMKTNPAAAHFGVNSEVFVERGQRQSINSDHPVEMITIFSAMEFANQLSLLHGFHPVYDLSTVNFESNTRASRGDLNLIEQNDITQIKILNPKRELYFGEGYRLPTQIELQFLNSNRGRLTTTYYFGDDLSEASFYEWLGNGDSQDADLYSQPVAKRRPLVIDGVRIFDLMGNVSSFCHVLSGNEPQDIRSLEGIRPGMFGLSGMRKRHGRYGTYRMIFQDVRDPLIGFRLVRSLPPAPRTAK